MKKVIGGLAALAFLFVVASCGSAEKDMIGKWKMDASAIDVKLGDGFPAEMKSEVNEGIKEMKSEGASELDAVTFDFQEGGKLVISADGEEQEMNWEVDGDHLIVSGEVEGQSGKIKLMIEDVSSDKMSVSLTAEELIAQVKEQMPELMEMAKGQTGGQDVEKMMKGSKLTIGFKK
jgi:hypothetical protein